jgi:hypothetical protein
MTEIWCGRQEIHTEYWKAAIWKTLKCIVAKKKAVGCGAREVHMWLWFCNMMGFAIP